MSALSDLIVLDLSRVLAGPHCTQTLADLGATVWKIESLNGDDTRHWGPPFLDAANGTRESAYFLSANRGKQSLAINLKDPRGQEILRALALKADVLIENFKVGDLARYGLDYPTLSALNPRLIYASITGFGQTGPRASEPGYDAALQGYTGIMSVTGEPDGQPMKVGVAWIDLMTGMHASIGILAALHERERSGLGQYLDLSLFEVGVSALANLGQSYLSSGQVPRRIGNAHAQIVPYGNFAAQDGFLVLAVGNDSQFAALCRVLDLAHLAQDERFATNPARVAHRAELVTVLEERLGTQPRAHWLPRLNDAKVPVAPVNTIDEVFADPQAHARGLTQGAEHATLGPVSLIGSPFAHLSRTPAQVSVAPPTLGQHTDAVLQGQLGLSESELNELRTAGVIASSLRKRD